MWSLIANKIALGNKRGETRTPYRHGAGMARPVFREANMTVNDLIQALQDCDKPDADVLLLVRHKGTSSRTSGKLSDVYFESVSDNTVIVEGEYE